MIRFIFLTFTIFSIILSDVPKEKVNSPLKDGRNCVDSWIGDGFCDEACNTGACNDDGGDCE